MLSSRSFSLKFFLSVILQNLSPEILPVTDSSVPLSLSYFTRRYDEVRGRKFSAIKPFIVMGVMGIFLLAQPDMGSTVVLFVITFGMLFIVGAHFLQFLFLIATGGILGLWLVVSASYRLKRFTGFLEPFKDPYGTGFQLTNSLMAFGRGEISGEGLGNSIQKLEYLPEAQIGRAHV